MTRDAGREYCAASVGYMLRVTPVTTALLARKRVPDCSPSNDGKQVLDVGGSRTE